jgi:hypothetical protein
MAIPNFTTIYNSKYDKFEGSFYFYDEWTLPTLPVITKKVVGLPAYGTATVQDAIFSNLEFFEGNPDDAYSEDRLLALLTGLCVVSNNLEDPQYVNFDTTLLVEALMSGIDTNIVIPVDTYVYDGGGEPIGDIVTINLYVYTAHKPCTNTLAYNPNIATVDRNRACSKGVKSTIKVGRGDEIKMEVDYDTEDDRLTNIGHTATRLGGDGTVMGAMYVYPTALRQVAQWNITIDEVTFNNEDLITYSFTLTNYANLKENKIDKDGTIIG